MEHTAITQLASPSRKVTTVRRSQQQLFRDGEQRNRAMMSRDDEYRHNEQWRGCTRSYTLCIVPITTPLMGNNSSPFTRLLVICGHLRSPTSGPVFVIAFG